jgi:para-nitrobenzyl esterase
MVWFHGGGNQTLDASTLFLAPPPPFPIKFNGRVLAETRNVIVVTINYRLGVFGFFSHPALAAEDATYPYAGNQGLLDQRAALQWVRDNIGRFGGDPDNVTIFGESAGSFDVCLHLVSPGSAGLFHRAISQSNGCTMRQATAAEAAPAVEQLVAAVGCEASSNVLPCLRQVPTNELLNANPRGDGWASANLIIDGGFLPDQPRALFDAGRFSKVPYLLGANAEEANAQLDWLGSLLDSEGGYLGALRSLFGERADQIAALYRPEDFPASDIASPELAALARAVGDRENVCPTYDTARRAAAGGADVYLYDFARPDAEPPFARLGADHQAEIGYVFGSIPLMTQEDEEVGRAMRGYWTRLASTGNPNGEGALEWPRYDDASDQRITFDVPLSVLTGFRRTECEFWWSLDDEAFLTSSMIDIMPIVHVDKAALGKGISVR